MPAKSGYIYLSVYYPAPSFSAAPYGSHPNPTTYNQRVLFDGDPLTCINLRSASCHVPVFRIMIPWFTGRDSYPTTFSVTVHHGNIFAGDARNVLVWTSTDGINNGKSDRHRLQECVLGQAPDTAVLSSKVFSCGCANWCDVHIWVQISPTVYSTSSLDVNLCEIVLI